MPEIITKPSWARFNTILSILTVLAGLTYGVASFGMPAKAEDVRFNSRAIIANSRKSAIHSELIDQVREDINRIDQYIARDEQRQIDIDRRLTGIEDNSREILRLLRPVP